MNNLLIANAPTRNWEAFDGIHFNDTQHAEGCKDIAAQLIEENSFIDVINIYFINYFEHFKYFGFEKKKS